MTTSLVHVSLHSLWEMVSPAQVCEVLVNHTCFYNRYSFFYSLIDIIVPDPCLSDPCDVNAVCLREGPLTDAFTCTCQAPFTEGDGFNCSG